MNKLQKQLSKLGINKAQAKVITVDGNEAVIVRWNGDEEQFFGFDDSDDADPLDEVYAVAKVLRFADHLLD